MKCSYNEESARWLERQKDKLGFVALAWQDRFPGGLEEERLRADELTNGWKSEKETIFFESPLKTGFSFVCTIG